MSARGNRQMVDLKVEEEGKGVGNERSAAAPFS